MSSLCDSYIESCSYFGAILDIFYMKPICGQSDDYSFVFVVISRIAGFTMFTPLRTAP